MIYTSDVVDWLKTGLEDDWPKVTFAAGTDPPKRWGANSGSLVLVAPGNGPGLNHEHVYDARAWYVQIFGPQSRDARVNEAFDRTEQLAYAVDEWFLFTSSRPLVIADHHLGRIQRFGSMGTPSVIGGASERAPWTATYVTDVPTALATL
jgi:hypothetical protein